MINDQILQELQNRANSKIVEAKALEINPEAFPVDPVVIESLLFEIRRLRKDVELLSSGNCAGTIPSSYVACGEDSNYCSKSCLLKNTIRELISSANFEHRWDMQMHCDARYSRGPCSCGVEEAVNRAIKAVEET